MSAIKRKNERESDACREFFLDDIYSEFIYKSVLNRYENSITERNNIRERSTRKCTQICDNNNVKISASEYKCSEVITAYSQLRVVRD